jgi:ornithine carbamoyltransferase
MDVVKHFIDIEDYTKEELAQILDLAKDLKQDLKQGKQHFYLAKKYIGMIFEKPSVRTRVSFEIGIAQLGGSPYYIQGTDIGIGVREPAKDIARVLDRYSDGIVIRANSHKTIEDLVKYSSVPVINALSDLSHPCQAMADVLTILEHKKSFDGLKLVYVGDGNNVCASLIKMSDKLGFEMVVACPKEYEPDYEGKNLTIENDPFKAVENADVIYTDVWTSMGQEEEKQKRLRDFNNYTISLDMLAKAKADVAFMHCLPAHRGEEVDDAVIESKNSIVFDQAENRLHAQKAILVTLFS